MSFYVFFLCGVLGGVLGGMGMGGGTLLIPLLNLFGVSQGVSQGVNLLAFLPMSAVALSVHAKNGLLAKDGLLYFVLPAVVCSVGASVVATVLPSYVLRRAFGAFLIFLSFYQFHLALKKE